MQYLSDPTPRKSRAMVLGKKIHDALEEQLRAHHKNKREENGK